MDSKSPDPENSIHPPSDFWGPETPDLPFHQDLEKSEYKRPKKSLDARVKYWVMNMVSHLSRIC